MADARARFVLTAEDQTRAAVASAQAGIRRLSATTGNLINNVFSLKGALAGLGVGLVAKGFLDAAREVENIGVRMQFLTSSTAEAAEATRLLTRYAAQSPATLQQITAAAPNLLVAADNLDELNKLLEITGDLSAVSGLSFQETAEQIQRALSAGAASADLFQQRGVNAMLGFQAGVSISAEETKRRIFDLWYGPGGATNTLKGAAAEMATTWDGLISMQQDRWDQFRRTLMDNGPFEFLKAALQELDANAAANFGSVEAAAEQMGRQLVLSFQAAVIGAAALADSVSGVASTTASAIGSIWDAFSALPTELQTAGVFAVLLFGKKGLFVVGGVLAGIESVRKAALETIDQTNAALRARGIEPPTTLLPRARNEATGRIERAGTTPPPDDGLDPDSFEARVRRILAAINERIEANRKLAAAQADVARGGKPGAGGGDGDAAADAAAQKAADRSRAVVDSLNQQIALYGQTSEAARLRYQIENNLLDGLAPRDRARALALVDELALLEQHAAAQKERAELAQEAERLTQDAQTAQERLNAALARYQELLAAGVIGQETYRRLAEAAQDAFEAQDAGAQLTRRLRTEQEIYNDSVAEYVRLLQQGSITQETFARAVEAAAEKLKDQADQMSEFAIQAARNMQSAFADFLFDPFSEGLDGMLFGFVQTLRRMASEALAAQLFEGIMGALGGAGAAGAAGGAGGTGGFAALLSGLFHTGGIAGQASAHRALPELAFAGAPRFHGGGIAGLAADEMPAILRRREEVLTEDDPRHSFNLGGAASEPPPMNFKFINAFDGATIRDEMSSAAGERVILNVVSRNKRLLGID